MGVPVQVHNTGDFRTDPRSRHIMFLLSCHPAGRAIRLRNAELIVSTSLAITGIKLKQPIDLDKDDNHEWKYFPHHELNVRFTAGYSSLPYVSLSTTLPLTLPSSSRIHVSTALDPSLSLICLPPLVHLPYPPYPVCRPKHMKTPLPVIFMSVYLPSHL